MSRNDLRSWRRHPSFLSYKNTHPSHETCTKLLIHYTTIIRPAEQPVPTFTPVSDCYLPWQLLSSKRFRLRRVGPLLTNVRGSGITGSRNQCHKCGLGTKMSKLWVGNRGLKNPEKGVEKGVQNRGQKRVKKPPFLGPRICANSAAWLRENVTNFGTY